MQMDSCSRARSAHANPQRHLAKTALPSDTMDCPRGDAASAVRIAAQQDPYRLAHRTGEMGNRGVHRDKQIQTTDHCRGIGEVPQLAAEVRQLRLGRPPFRIFRPRVLLHRHKGGIGGEQRPQLRQAHRTVAVIGVTRISRPGQPHARASQTGESGRPVSPFRIVGG